MKLVRNASFVLLFVTLSIARGLAVEDCPSELKGDCQQCFLDGNSGYVYYGCPETCNENNSICDDWCTGGSDTNCDVNAGATYGHCSCDPF